MSEQKILATVAGKEITEKEFEMFLENVPQEQKRFANNPRYREHYQEQFINHYLFAQLGADMKLDESEDFIAIIENAKRDVLAQMAMVVALKDLTVSDEEAVEFYNNHPEEFTVEPTVKARHILVPEEAQAKIALEEILQGKKTFEEAAQEYSTCPSGQVGGDLGEFGRGQMVKEFEDAAFSAEVGKVYGPVQTQFGFHLIKVEEKKDATISPFETEKSAIMKKLMQDKQAAKYAEKVAELREKYLG